jgi:hypothetical protein
MIKHEKGKWVLYTKDGSKVLGKHDTEDDALAQEQAIEIAKHKRGARLSRSQVARLCTTCAESMEKKGLTSVSVDALLGSPRFLSAVQSEFIREAGGPGSGFFGHGGRPGQIGGSSSESEGGGSVKITSVASRVERMLPRATINAHLAAFAEKSMSRPMLDRIIKENKGLDRTIALAKGVRDEFDPDRVDEVLAELEPFLRHSAAKADKPTAEDIEQDQGFFTYCKEKPIGPGTDEFCSWLHNKLLGYYPGDVKNPVSHRDAGGPGSGNFGHAGRPGEVGGSSGESNGIKTTRNIDVPVRYQKDYQLGVKTGQEFLKEKSRKVTPQDPREEWVKGYSAQSYVRTQERGAKDQFEKGNHELAWTYYAAAKTVAEHSGIKMSYIPVKPLPMSAWEKKHKNMSGQRSATVRVASAGRVERVTIDGRPHLKVPVVALVEGVLTASNAPNAERVLADDIAESVDAWEGMPFVMDHPRESGGRRLSARDPKVRERYAFGHVTNARMSNDGKRLLMDALLDPERAKAVGSDAERLLARAEAGDLVSVSVGVLVDTEMGEGVHGGKRYAATWKNIVPDHLAGLPERVPGACSLEMGCGLPRAAAQKKEEKRMSVMERVVDAVRGAFRSATEPTGPSDDELRTSLQDGLYAEIEGEDLSVWVSELYEQDGMFVYSTTPVGGGEQTYYRRSYTADADGNVTLGDDAEEVKLRRVYEPVTQAEETEEPVEEELMSEENRVASEGTGDDDSFREDGALTEEETGMTEETGVTNAAVQKKIDEIMAAAQKQIEEIKATAQKQVEEGRAASAKENAELRAEVEKMRPIVAEHEARVAARKAELVGELKTASAFTENALTDMSVDMLETLKKTVDKNKAMVDFSGRAMPRAAAASGIPSAPSVFAKAS